MNHIENVTETTFSTNGCQFLQWIIIRTVGEISLPSTLLPAINYVDYICKLLSLRFEKSFNSSWKKKVWNGEKFFQIIIPETRVESFDELCSDEEKVVEMCALSLHIKI